MTPFLFDRVKLLLPLPTVMPETVQYSLCITANLQCRYGPG